MVVKVDNPLETVGHGFLMCNANNGLITKYCEKVIQYLFFHHWVESRREFIEDKYLRIANDSPSQCDTLLLPAGKIDAVLPENRGITLR